MQYKYDKNAMNNYIKKMLIYVTELSLPDPVINVLPVAEKRMF